MPLIEPHLLNNRNNSNGLVKKMNTNSGDEFDNNNNCHHLTTEASDIQHRETDPNIYQFLQNIIQLIYQSRSNSIGYLSSSSSLLLSDPFDIKNFECGSFQSTNININDLGDLKDKDIHLELGEINEINRDLSLWCEHLNSSPLKLDIFACTEKGLDSHDENNINKTTPQYEHQLLERWMLKFTPKQLDSLSTPGLSSFTNRQITISDELNIISPMITSSELTGLLPIDNHNNNNNNNNSNNNVTTSNLVKSLYYILPSIPLFSYILKYKNQKEEKEDIKIKYGTSQHYPPPINFQPSDYKHLVKINFPIQETSLGSLSLTLQFPNRELSLASLNSIVIYPSRSCSTNLICHHIVAATTTITTTTTLATSLNNLNTSPSLKSLLTKTISTTQSNNSNDNSTLVSKLITTTAISTVSTITIDNNKIIPPTTTSPIDFSSNSQRIGNGGNNQHTSPSKNINIAPPPLNGKYSGGYGSNRSPPSLTSLSLGGYSSTPPSLSSFSPIHNHFKSTSPKFNNNPLSPPSSPYRIGYRPLFSSNDSINNNNPYNLNSSSSGLSNSPSTFVYSNNNNNNNYVEKNSLTFGSFQESILSGQMSNTPSTQFVGYLCDLGVSGKDYIPPHRKIEFQALYYHVDHDTPYVADIDLGSKGYKVPPKGLIQLTIFNPFGTPIKTFLVNFDISDMPQDSKTFIRQKIISIDSNTQQLQQQQQQSQQHLLKYAIHLKFISPKKRKYYLYKNIRVVFPNRLPDEMEKLKVFYEYPPDPRYYPTLSSSTNGGSSDNFLHL